MYVDILGRARATRTQTRQNKEADKEGAVLADYCACVYDLFGRSLGSRSIPMRLVLRLRLCRRRRPSLLAPFLTQRDRVVVCLPVRLPVSASLKDV